MSDLTILCDQRQRRLTSSIPSIRFELFNPYLSGIYKQRDLDMRRKAEILKYSSNKMSTQTNRLTKKQQFAQIMQGNYSIQPSNYVVDPSTNDIIVPESYNCPNDDMMILPSSASGVPGKSIGLYLDKRVPLYNYATNNRSYPFNIQSDFGRFKVDTREDILFPHNSENEFFELMIKDNIDKQMYNFYITFPVSIFVMGVIANNAVQKTLPFTVNIYSITANFYYSNNLMKVMNLSPTISQLVFDVNGKNGAFNAVQYVGNLTISGAKLFTEPGYIYDIKLLFRLSISGGGANYLSNIQMYAYANASMLNNQISNCNVRSLPSTVPNKGFILTAS